MMRPAAIGSSQAAFRRRHRRHVHRPYRRRARRQHRACTRRRPCRPIRSRRDRRACAVAGAAAGEPLRRLSRRAAMSWSTAPRTPSTPSSPAATARTAFLTTQGHPDTLVFREGGRQEPFNFTIPYPEPFVPKALTFEIRSERVLATARCRQPLDEAAVGRDPAAPRGTGRRGRRGLPSVVDRQSRARARRRAPDRAASAGRSLHAVASDQPVDPRISARHVDLHRCFAEADHGRLHARARRRGCATPALLGRVLVVTSQGGVMDAADVAARPST